MTFLEHLELDLSLKIGAKKHVIPAGQVKRLNFEAWSFGYDGYVEFVIPAEDDSDELFKSFTDTDLITVNLAMTRIDPGVERDPSFQFVATTTAKGLSEEFVNVAGQQKLLFRRYALEFADPAQVFWRQHYPIEIHAAATLETVLKAQQMGGISLDFQWGRLKAKHPVICLPLKEHEGPNFYEWLAWLCWRDGGGMFYDYSKKKYVLTDDKPKATATDAFHHDIAGMSMRIEESSRQNVRVLNGFSEKPNTFEKSLDDAVDNVRRDTYVIEPIEGRLKIRQGIEKKRPRETELSLIAELKRLPGIDMNPNALVKFAKDQFENLYSARGKTFRSRAVRFRGASTKLDSEADVGASTASFVCELQIELESKNADTKFLPRFRAPRYPVLAEGRVVSELGAEGDRTYQIFTDSETSLDKTRVYVPLWNKKIDLPFRPGMFSSQFFFPLVRDSRVVVALDAFDGWIHEQRDWAETVRLPMDGQGNHILFGKNATSQTSLKHAYVESKPQLSVLRTFGQDAELIEMTEGGMVLEVKENKSAKKAKDTVDLTPQVLAAKAQLGGEGGAAVAASAAQYEAGRAKLDDQIDGSVDDVSSALEDMEAQIDEAVTVVRDEITTALADIQGAVADLNSAADALIAELQAIAQL